MFQTVVMSLNEGFVKSLEIFILTLLGAIPLGLIMSFGSMSSFKPCPSIAWLRYCLAANRSHKVLPHTSML